MKWSLTATAAVLVIGSQLGASENVCASCHPAETKLHLQTHMSHAMVPALTSSFARYASGQSLHESAGGFQYTYQPDTEGLQVTAALGKKTATGWMEWILGSGQQGQTPVVRDGKSIYESRVSYYSRVNQFGVTIGQPAGKSADAHAALGRKLSKHDAATCLGCHATGLTKDVEPVVAGVQCERCHAGATEHSLNGKGDVVNPGKLQARKQVELCGVCHRVKPPVDDLQLENVRFQPLRLMKSRCFNAGQLDCLTCHPAHRDAVRNNAAFYNEKCQNCHATGKSVSHVDDRRTGDCISCHMPRVQLHPGLRFTDHYIRKVATS